MENAVVVVVVVVVVGCVKEEDKSLKASLFLL